MNKDIPLFEHQPYQKYSPNVFDDSLSFYEQIIAFVEYLNQVIQNSNEVTEEVLLLRNQFELFKIAVENDLLPSGLETLLNEWLLTGKLSTIINEILFDSKADKADYETFKSNIQSQVLTKASKDSVSVLEAQIQGLIAQSGDVSNNAELLDIRVGADGIVYSTGGAHVRAVENGHLTDGSLVIDKLGTAMTEKTVNLFNKYKVVSKSVVNADGSVLADSSTTTHTTEPIFGVAGDYFKVTQMRSMAFYTPSGALFQHINDFEYHDDYGFTMPLGATSFVISFRQDLLQIFMVVKDGRLPSTYVEHKMLRTNYIPVDKINKTLESKYFEKTVNWFDKNSYRAGYFDFTGKILQNDALITTQEIKVNEGDTVYMSQLRCLAMYDKNGVFDESKFISIASYPTNYSVVIPVGIKTIAVSFQKAIVDRFQITINTPLGSYVPYMQLRKDYLPNVSIDGTSEKINVLAKTFITVGSELIIKNRNIVKNKETNVDFNSTVGSQKADGYHYTPTVVGTNALNVEIYEKDKLLTSKPTQIIAVSKRTTPITVLIPGDSTVNSNGTGEISKNIKVSIGDNVTMIGKRGIVPYMHEGRGGWTALSFNQPTVYEGVTNPFYDPITKKFSLTYYLAQTGQATPDVIGFQLGINDTFNTLNVEGTIANFNVLIDTIKASHPNMKIVLAVTIPPSENQDVFGMAYGASQNQWKYKYNNFDWVAGMIKNYEGTVDLIATHYGIDTNTMFADGVHPTNTGYAEMSKQWIGYLNSI